ncbi:Ubiquinone/menaquinone biosynthesis C-methylase UbiE [Bosea sp. CRIB-10]|jgi:ubiquinone/menaquinone biosynthesis C-methylase UbiE|uniref:class I SAM-dependent methyltransferase n=1 Tax=Bosea sp. CRIB-10 TaxID=378404 RepID=UPI0008E9DDCA|nr:class I SAM-dependent methyltransferase [Bosea sp. CRIB-10]SFD31219.1 Ubiquinone/menaquinone biosynthesis C-methylase UbiE [Bosea sp. CRIB-10]
MHTTAPAAAKASSNYDLKEDIRAYWSKRSETFDLACGHKIRGDREFAGWVELISSYWQPRPGARALELASGTGEVTRVLLALGLEVDAVDFSEPMLARARVKHAGALVRFHLGDAENTMMPDGHYDLAICRHLVWTLVDPQRALADWLRTLKPGGTLIIVDGDWVTPSVKAKALSKIAGWLDSVTGSAMAWDSAAHQRIIAQVHFRDGLTVSKLSTMLERGGYGEIRSTSLSGIKKLQFETASWAERLRLIASMDKAFIVAARKPG